MEFVALKAMLADGLVDLSDFTVAQMLAVAGIGGGWTVTNGGTPLQPVIDRLKEPQIRIVVRRARDLSSSVILRAHRRC